MAVANPVTTASAQTVLGTVINDLENQLGLAISTLQGSALSQEKLLEIQVKIQQWNTAISLLASLTKEIADTIKGIIQKF